ncbi:alanine racemase [Sorangium sp. So ce131]|uniref:alanine racemase n=1 Tax=Sorangium sp. So ce131 TaxID=3133282 RepID=UPI003F5F6704
MSASHAPAELSSTTPDRNGNASALDGLGSIAGPVRVLRPRRAAPADAVRPTRAEVNLANLRHNLRVLERAMSGASKPQIWGVLKADAYGHGAPAVARTLERTGIPGLCVALLEEAVELRDAGIRVPILVMGGYYGPRREGFEEILARDLVPVVYDAGQIERLANLLRLEQRGRVGVHLKVDTGMGRLGAAPSELDAVLATLAKHPEVRLDGLMTHLACADADDLGVTLDQMRRFEEIEQRARRFGLTPRLRHASNSAAMLRLPAARLDVVRPGVALFGISPCPGLAPDLKPVIRVRSEVVALRTVEKGERIGYGHTWEAARQSVVATVPMGYADGLSRQLSNRGAALMRGQRAPIAGTVSMDLTMLDVTDIPGARVGDEVVFLGTQDGPLGRATISAEEIAGLTGTIPWEVLTSISRRVPRFYREP